MTAIGPTAPAVANSIGSKYCIIVPFGTKWQAEYAMLNPKA